MFCDTNVFGKKKTFWLSFNNVKRLFFVWKKFFFLLSGEKNVHGKKSLKKRFNEKSFLATKFLVEKSFFFNENFSFFKEYSLSKKISLKSFYSIFFCDIFFGKTSFW